MALHTLTVVQNHHRPGTTSSKHAGKVRDNRLSKSTRILFQSGDLNII